MKFTLYPILKLICVITCSLYVATAMAEKESNYKKNSNQINEGGIYIDGKYKGNYLNNTGKAVNDKALQKEMKKLEEEMKDFENEMDNMDM